ncbi:MAG: phBC6A51 family helix-turn-helix protein [Thermomicrobiales bacterium]
MEAPTAEQNRTASDGFPWSDASANAAVLLAEDRLTDAAIAKKVGVGRTKLHEWKQHPVFAAKVTALSDELIARARRRGLARLDRRLERYERRARAFDMIVSDRAKAMKEVPGGRSGYLVRHYKSIGTGETAHEVEEYHFDAALSREMRELEKQVAQDTGQWTDKRELTGKDGGAISVSIEAEAQAVAETLGVPVAVILAEAERLAKLEAGDDA